MIFQRRRYYFALFISKFVITYLILRTMSDNRVSDFFYPGNAVHDEPD